MPAARCGIRLPGLNYVWTRGAARRGGVARKANTARYLIDLGDRRQPRTFPAGRSECDRRMEFREHLARSVAVARNRSKDIGIRPTTCHGQHLQHFTSRNEQTSDCLDLSLPVTAFPKFPTWLDQVPPVFLHYIFHFIFPKWKWSPSLRFGFTLTMIYYKEAF